MAENRQCPQCGEELPADAPMGLCPQCVLNLAAQTQQATGSPMVAEPSPAPAPGTKVRYFGDYELLEEIGRGGMGVVYKARQVSLDRIVALKMILAGQLASEVDVQRFHTEAEAAGKLDHPSIVPIFEVGQHEGRHYFSMGYVEGQSLAELVREHPLPAKRSAAYVKAIAEAIHYAHQKGILHRDLKPSNVLIDRADHPRITDFGLAKRMADDRGLTVSGQLLGTPSYMSPEQAAGKSRDTGPPSDVYSLGALLYDLLTGRPPFQAASATETLLQVVTREPVSPRQLNPAVPRDLETIALKCLEKKPARRYQSAQELTDELRRFLDGRPIAARPLGAMGRAWRWCKRKPAVAILAATVLTLLVVVAVGSLIAALRISTQSERIAAQAEENHLQLVQMHVAGGMSEAKQGEWGRAALWFAEALRLDAANPARAENHRIRVAATLNRCPKLGRVWFHDHHVIWAELSPDGRRVLTVTERGARLWDVATGEAVTPPLQHRGGINAASFSPDGRHVVTASEDHTARVWDATTGRALAKPLHHQGGVDSAVFSPDGSLVLTYAGVLTSESQGSRGYRTEIQVWDTSTGEPVAPLILITEGWSLEKAEFSPDGRVVVLSAAWAAGTGYRASVWETKTGRPANPELYAEVKRVRFSPDGQKVVVVAKNRKTRVYEAATGKELTPPFGNGYGEALFSQDGLRILTRGSGSGISVWNAVTGQRIGQPIKGEHEAAVFSPDGRLVLTTDLNGYARVWNADTGAAATAPLKTAVLAHMEIGGALHARFSPDGRSVLTARGSVVRVWDAADGRPLSRPLVHGDKVTAASFSPDGRWVLTASRDGTARAWRVGRRGPLGFTFMPRDKQGRGEIHHCVAFSPGGNRMLVCYGGGARLWDVAAGKQLLVLKHPPYQHPDDRGEGKVLITNVLCAAFSPDGRQVATGGSDGLVRLWDVGTGKLLLAPMVHKTRVTNVAFSFDGRRMVSAGDGTARVWDVATGKPATAPLNHKPPLGLGGSFFSDLRAVFSPDGSRIVSVDFHGAQIWDAATGKRLVAWLPCHHPNWDSSTDPLGTAFSPDSKLIVTTGDEPRVYDASTGEPISPPLVHSTGASEADVDWAELSPDSQYVVTAAEDYTARIWEAATGKPIIKPLRHTSPVVYARFSPDGRRVLTLSRDAARLWDAATGEPLTPPLPIRCYAYYGRPYATLSPDGLRAVVCDGSRAIAWDVGPDSRPIEDLVRLAQIHACAMIDPTGGVVPLPVATLRRDWEELQSRYPNDFR